MAREPDDGGLQKEVEKHFGRQELRRATFAEVGETAYPRASARATRRTSSTSLDVASIRERRFRVAIDYGHSPAAFTLPLVLGPLGVEAIGARGTYADDVASELEPIDASRIVTGVRADLGVVLDRAASASRSSTSGARRCRPTSRCSSSSGCSSSPAARAGSRCR